MPLIPVLMTALGAFGPDIVKWIAGDKAGDAAKVIADKAREIFGSDDPQAIEKALARDPQLALQYSMAVLAAKTERERIEAEKEKAAQQAERDKLLAVLTDIQSARSTMTSLAASSSPMAWGAAIVSVLSIVLAGTVAYMLLFPSPSAAKWTETVVTLWVGAAINWVATVQNFWLGSSLGSQTKDASMAEMKALLLKGKG